MAEQDLRAYLIAWRKAEDKYYGSVLSAPELYTAGVKLVRGIADDLKTLPTVEALLEVYPQMTIRRVADIAETLDLIQRDFLDYNLARDAAFYLRHREILEAQAKTEMEARIAEAQAVGDAWVTLFNTEQAGQGVPFFQRLEMHLPDGLGIYSAIELDWEKGRVYVVEPLVLDPASGELLHEIRPSDPRQEFTNREAMIAAVAALRQKYSNPGEKP